MRYFDERERRQADLFYADLVGVRRHRRRATAGEERSSISEALIAPSQTSQTSIDAGRLFDGIVHQRMHPSALLASEAEEEEGRWEAVALPRSATPRQCLPDGALVVGRALGEGRLAYMRVLGRDVGVRELYGPDGCVRPDVLVLVWRRTRPAPHWLARIPTFGDAEDSDLSFLRWSPATRAGYFPARDSAAVGGRAFMETIKGEGAPTDWVKRENAIVAQLAAGNMPDALLRWIKIDLAYSDKKRSLTGTIEVLPDYLLVGSNDDFVHVPLDPVSAQLVADRFDTILPTARICHAIYKQAAAKNRINAIERDYYAADAVRKSAKRGRAQTSTASYLEHSEAIQAKMKSAGIALGELVAGHKKDVVIAKRLHADPEKIAFHGFYDNKEYPHEPCYENADHAPKPSCDKESPTLAHSRRFSDYSQGVRLVNPWMIVNGDRKMVADVLADPDLSLLISSEGPIVPPRIPRTVKPSAGPRESDEEAAPVREAFVGRSRAGLLERPRATPEDFSEDVPAGLITDHLWQEWHASQAPTRYAGPTDDDRRVVENAPAAGGALVAKARLHLCFLERAVTTFVVDVAGVDYWAAWEIISSTGAVVRKHPSFTTANSAAKNAAAKLATGRFAFVWDGRNSAANPVFVAAGTYRSRITVRDSAGATRVFTTSIEVEGEPYSIFINGQPKSDADLAAALASPPGGAAWTGRLLNASGERIGNDCWLKVFRGQRDAGHTVFLGHGTIEATNAGGAPKFGAIQTPHGTDFKGWIRRDPHGRMNDPDRVQIEDAGSTNEHITLPHSAAAPVSNPFTDDASHGAFKDGVQAHRGAVATTNGLSVGCTTSCPISGRTCADPGAETGGVRSINSSFGSWGGAGENAATVGGPDFVNKQNKRDVADALLADNHAAPLLNPAGVGACAGRSDEPLHMQPTAQQGVFGGFKAHEIPLTAAVADAPVNSLRIRMQLETYPVGGKYHIYHHAVAFGHAFELSGRDLTVRVWIPRKVIREWNGNHRNVLVRGNCKIRWTLEHVHPGGAARVVLHRFDGAAGGGFVDLPNGDVGRAQRAFRLPVPAPASPLFSVFRYQLELLPFVDGIDAWVAESAYADSISPNTAALSAETLSTTAARRFVEGRNELTIP